MKLKAFIGGILGLAIVVGMAVACLWAVGKMRETTSDNTEILNESSPNQTSTPTETNVPQQIHLAPGNPSNATANPANANNYLLSNKYYAVSYNRQKAIANWVSWRLVKNGFGDASRQNDFRPNQNLPNGWTQIMPNDYSGSGFDRGHLCPSADRSSSIESNSSTFLMTNIAPQTHDLNTGPWEKLETYSRSLAKRNNTLYIITGQYGDDGKVRNKLTIPTNFWKIVVILPNNGEVSAINRETRIIAVDMPNVDGIGQQNWRDFKTTVRQIEQKTGYNFLSNVPQNIQDALETKADSRGEK
jgi:endonuclease G, mitochondrial